MNSTLVARAALCASALLAATLLAACGSSAPRAQIPMPRPTVLNTSPSTASELHIANTALQGGNVQMAASIYERELAAHPDSTEALLGLAEANYIEGDMSHARALYERAGQIAKGARGPRLGLARVAIRERRFADAILLYQPLVAANPADAVAYAGLGTAYDMSGRHSDAQSVYRKGLVATPGDVALRTNLGLSLVLDGQPREGANLLLDVANSPSAPPQARQNLALAYGVLGNDDAAGRILSVDLPKGSVNDDLRYYDAVRALLAKQPASDAPPVRGPAATDTGIAP
ncbi:tetratricopeptide repeat protein [Paraburkholderia sp. PREW-6R]|uniref:tetratricopeptide repeat protein n=1 Tax=Paraburkholderia sp. PREW-6R TaxID=3141544 RepID=UPI0031F49377